MELTAADGAVVRPTTRTLEGRPLRWAAAVAILVVMASLTSGVRAQPPISSRADRGLLSAAARAGTNPVSVIIRESRPASHEAEALVRTLGGRVTHELPIVGGFSARLPGSRVAELATSNLVDMVWGDGRIHMSTDTSYLNATTSPNRAWEEAIRLPQIWDDGYTGRGVTVALLDTGISHVADLGNRVLARVDLTGEQDGLDHFGHGTHMAGIIAGDGTSAGDAWSGVAPQTRVVSVKVAGADGSTDVSVVIAGLQWVVSHQDDYNIRVLNLSFGTDSRQGYLTDPLDYAVERVWFSGITVVTAAGNRGPSAGTINKPADDPFVITVGAADLNGTRDRSDDEVATFSSRGPTQDGIAKPGIFAPGVTIVSNRAVGSSIDLAYPSARVGTAYFKGTGTSQAAAIVSGIAALMYQANPSLTPDLLKGVLRLTSYGSPRMVDANLAVWTARYAMRFMAANVGLDPSTGLGSLEASRGSAHVYADLPQDGLGAEDADGQTDPVQGEIDALGQPWSPPGWLATGWAASAWASVAWSATGWSATGWSATGWSGTSWSATGWSATGWSATGWSATGWNSSGWSGTSWS